MAELNLSWADQVGGVFSNAATEIASAWATATADRIRGTDGNPPPAPTTADQYDQRVVTPDDGGAREVAEAITGTVNDLKKWGVVALLVGAAAFIYSRS